MTRILNETKFTEAYNICIQRPARPMAIVPSYHLFIIIQNNQPIEMINTG